MPIPHKFLQKDWENGFKSNSAILDETPYKPKVLIIGTYNPNTQGAHNLAQFYYGRDNYLIPSLHGIFNLRTTYTQAPSYDNILWPLCNSLQLSFADLITTVFPTQNGINLIPNSNNVVYLGTQYNLLKDADLIALNILNELILS